MLPTLTTASKLTTKQAAFVSALVRNGGDREQAAIDAGYSPRSARTQAYQLLAIPHVVAAIVEQTGMELAAAVPRASATLIKLLEGKSEYVRLEAANSLLDRVGMKAPERHDHRVSGDITVNIDLG